MTKIKEIINKCPENNDDYGWNKVHIIQSANYFSHVSQEDINKGLKNKKINTEKELKSYLEHTGKQKNKYREGIKILRGMTK